MRRYNYARLGKDCNATLTLDTSIHPWLFFSFKMILPFVLLEYEEEGRSESLSQIVTKREVVPKHVPDYKVIDANTKDAQMAGFLKLR